MHGSESVVEEIQPGLEVKVGHDRDVIDRTDTETGLIAEHRPAIGGRRHVKPRPHTKVCAVLRIIKHIALRVGCHSGCHSCHYQRGEPFYRFFHISVVFMFRFWVLIVIQQFEVVDTHHRAIPSCEIIAIFA